MYILHKKNKLNIEIDMQIFGNYSTLKKGMNIWLVSNS